MQTRLKELRKAAGFKSAKSFAEYMSMPVSTYAGYEQGVRTMDLQTAVFVAEKLGCKLDDLVEDKESISSELTMLFERMDANSKVALMIVARSLAATNPKENVSYAFVSMEK